MWTVEQIIEAMRRLPLEDQRRIAKELRAALDELERDRSPEGPYARSLAAAGSSFAGSPDVSSDKYTALAEAYGDLHEDTCF